MEETFSMPIPVRLNELRLVRDKELPRPLHCVDGNSFLSGKPRKSLKGMRRCYCGSLLGFYPRDMSLLPHKVDMGSAVSHSTLDVGLEWSPEVRRNSLSGIFNTYIFTWYCNPGFILSSESFSSYMVCKSTYPHSSRNVYSTTSSDDCL